MDYRGEIVGERREGGHEDEWENGRSRLFRRQFLAGWMKEIKPGNYRKIEGGKFSTGKHGTSNLD